ncbi:hypothetical protein SAMN04487910_4132 [Aquimarina amphilecti]|uniref:Tetratricopeptide repeat-containing protein n=1 Tax=Aquimarina amphilecti TaxID=1038014 RepID=A0A1H7VPF9_AQUAM|nr:DUF6340 family protein [Aquimarina amphilecti]SEM11126.1 hypothetical protein SAMN04487910_4132 [Aquimarina amphilecti]
MKNIFTYKTLVSAMVVLIAVGCGSKKSLRTEVIKPPIVTLDSSVKKIGILNRSIPSDENVGLDQVDKILSIEGAKLDEDGARQAMIALKTALLQNPRFTEVTILSNSLKENPGGGIFPSPISWDQINDLCKTNNIDAVFTLALYDTDAKASYTVENKKIEGPLGIELPAVEHKVSIDTKIKTGWRIYDPIRKKISDQLSVNEKTKSVGKGINPIKAIEAATNRKQSVLQISQKIGSDYASRLLPYKDNVYRDYYVKATPNFEVAKRKVETGQWEGAAELWEKETNNSDPEIAGQACFNMAFYNEIKGDYTKAIEWATKAYTDYENKNALRYINDLKERIEDNKIVGDY